MARRLLYHYWIGVQDQAKGCQPLDTLTLITERCAGDQYSIKGSFVPDSAIDTHSEVSVLKVGGIARKAALAMVLAFSMTALAQQPDMRGGQRGGARGFDGRDWSDRSKQERLDFLAKVLAWHKKAPEPSAEILFLLARATELLERTRQASGNSFQFDRYARATDSLIRAVERIFMARKATQVDENERRDAALFLQRCYFRVQQAEYFAGIGGEKEAKQYVTYARSFYQLARSAYDAHQYDRAQMLGDASSLLVTALENIAQASLRIPDPPVIK